MDKNNDWIWWLVIIALLCTATPIGLIVLFLYLNRDKKQKQLPEKTGTANTGKQDVYRMVDDALHSAGSAVDDAMRSVSDAVNSAFGSGNKKTAADKKTTAEPTWVPKQTPRKVNKQTRSRLRRAKLARIAGLITTGIFSFSAIVALFDHLAMIWRGINSPMDLLADMVPLSLFAALGGLLALWGHMSVQKALRFERYQNLIQPGRATLSVHALADAMELRYSRVCDDLQEMIDQRYFDFAYLDRAKGKLILSPELVNLYETPPAPKPKAESTSTVDPEEAMLRRIRAANNIIADPALSAKIDEIEMLTKKILRLLEQRPEKADSLHSFTGYYLPQTLKLTEAYARLESQGVEGENITTAKQKITDALDMLADGYRQQLDQLFEDDVVDITADIAVMEQMLARDGLSGDELQPERRQ